MRRFALLLPFAFAACVDETVPTAGTCGAPALQDLVGQSETVLQTMKFGSPVRIIHPGMAVTMDYNADRLNIWLDRRDVSFRHLLAGGSLFVGADTGIGPLYLSVVSAPKGYTGLYLFLGRP